ncbi:hypothetical protein HAAEEKHM_00047 [Sinorhizobium phage AP-16-3]|nr:hypothetical protein HAAEEKHM_00047 [Sinorhizobium phage AP-16-3]
MGGVIPEDVMMAARECVRESFADPLSPMQGYVASAILAERQRCADRADKWAKDDLQNGEVRLAAAYIRREIMSGEK